MANSTSDKEDLRQEDELIAKNVAAVSVEGELGHMLCLKSFRD